MTTSTYTEPISYNQARLVPALRDVTPQLTRTGDVVIDVTYVVYSTSPEGVRDARSYHACRWDAAQEAERIGGTAIRETITQTLDEYRESEFCRIHDC